MRSIVVKELRDCAVLYDTLCCGDTFYVNEDAQDVGIVTMKLNTGDAVNIVTPEDAGSKWDNVGDIIEADELMGEYVHPVQIMSVLTNS